jgi:hypothetical protein
MVIVVHEERLSGPKGVLLSTILEYLPKWYNTMPPLSDWLTPKPGRV